MTVRVCPAMVAVRVCARALLLTGMVTVAWSVPCGLALGSATPRPEDEGQTQADDDAWTLMAALPPDAGMLRVIGSSEKEQLRPNWVTVKVWPPAEMVPVRWLSAV